MEKHLEGLCFFFSFSGLKMFLYKSVFTFWHVKHSKTLAFEKNFSPFKILME